MAFIVYVLIRVQEPRFGKEKYELVEEGMTEAEVVEALGYPAGEPAGNLETPHLVCISFISHRRYYSRTGTDPTRRSGGTSKERH